MTLTGWTPDILEDISPSEAREIVAARMVYDELMFRRSTYDAARMGAFFSMIPHVKKNSLKHPTDLLKFSHEQEKEKDKKPRLTGEALKAEIYKLKR